VRSALARVHHFDAVDKDALFIWDTMDGAKMLDKIFGVVTIFFGCVAIVTLCLGGIGVMNIMLVFSHRAHPRNRHAQSDGRHQARHPAAVFR